MKASELIEQLQKLIDEHGDLEVHQHDRIYGGPLPWPADRADFGWLDDVGVCWVE